MNVLLRNKKIHLDYEILETYTAGISLLGHEVKSLKHHNTSLDGTYVTVDERDGKYSVLLHNLHIPPYQTTHKSADSVQRKRMLLLNKKEIQQIQKESRTPGVTVVPKSIANYHEKIKIEIALVRGKKKYDKRQDIKKRDQKRDAERDVKTSFK